MVSLIQTNFRTKILQHLILLIVKQFQNYIKIWINSEVKLICMHVFYLKCFFICIYYIAGLCNFAFGTSLFPAEQLCLDVVWRFLFTHSTCISIYIRASFSKVVNGIWMDCASLYINIIWNITRYSWNWNTEYAVSYTGYYNKVYCFIFLLKILMR